MIKYLNGKRPLKYFECYKVLQSLSINIFKEILPVHCSCEFKVSKPSRLKKKCS
uniref:Uncharacterized protein n=1 Tax=Arundo donax TaxID=35708 RepID=A0A0A9APV9_ARUDO